MESARRALEVAAAGGHNLLLVGPPGAGKSMLAARLPGLLPDLSPRRGAGGQHGPQRRRHAGRRPPRDAAAVPRAAPRRLQAALAGGGQRARPGEVSLAHRGVLFLDELPEFPRPALESLRQPLESGKTTVARAAAHVTYPARFQLVAAMNPCRCGYLGDAARECNKAPRCGEDYLGRISGPLLDRIDMVVHVHPTSPAELSRAPPGEASETVAARVATARQIQRDRFGPDRRPTNAEAGMDDLDLQPDARALAEQAAERLRLSARGFTRVLRVARTIADLAASMLVRRADVAEALAYRHRVPAGPSRPEPEKKDRRMVGATGIEPVTPAMSRRCSTAELRAHPLDGGLLEPGPSFRNRARAGT